MILRHCAIFLHKPTATKELESISVNGSVVRPATDILGRHTDKIIEVDGNKIAEEKISYVKFGDHATNLPASVRFARYMLIGNLDTTN